MAKPTPEQICALFLYDPFTGVITRKQNGNTIFRNKDKDGYITITFKKGKLYAHQIAFVCHYRKWPDGQIDHINGEKTDNRICNLRDVPQHQNLENIRKATRRNSSGVLGVSLHYGKWRAKIQVNRKQISLGSFDTKEEAHLVYIEAKRRLHVGCSL